MIRGHEIVEGEVSEDDSRDLEALACLLEPAEVETLRALVRQSSGPWRGDANDEVCKCLEAGGLARWLSIGPLVRGIWTVTVKGTALSAYLEQMEVGDGNA